MLAGLLKSDEQTDAEAAGDEELAQSVSFVLVRVVDVVVVVVFVAVMFDSCIHS